MVDYLVVYGRLSAKSSINLIAPFRLLAGCRSLQPAGTAGRLARVAGAHRLRCWLSGGWTGLLLVCILP